MFLFRPRPAADSFLHSVDFRPLRILLRPCVRPLAPRRPKRAKCDPKGPRVATIPHADDTQWDSTECRRDSASSTASSAAASNSHPVGVHCPFCGHQPPASELDEHLRSCIRGHVGTGRTSPTALIDDLNFCDECGERITADSLLAQQCVLCGQDVPLFV